MFKHIEYNIFGCSDNNHNNYVIKTGVIATQGFYATNQLSWPFHIIDINCTGSEITIWNCSLNSVSTCSPSQEAAIRCQGLY